MQDTTAPPFPEAAVFEAIDMLVGESYGTAFAKGWHDDEHPASFGDRIALVHSELSEVLEEFRNGRGVDEIYYTGQPVADKPEGIAAELADVLIRIFDMSGKYEIPLARALSEKLSFNRTRPYRHGGKAL